MKNRSIYTLGTDLRSAEDFIEILLACEIRAVIDVRSFPVSRMSHFSKGPFSELLTSNGIAYYFFGKELGGFRKGGYAAYMTTGEFSDGVGMIETVAKEAVLLLSVRKNYHGSATESGYPGSSSTGDGLSGISLTKAKSGNQNRQCSFQAYMLYIYNSEKMTGEALKIIRDVHQLFTERGLRLSTGNLGPDLLEGKERGLVYAGISKEGKTIIKELRLTGDRTQNKEEAAFSALRF